MGKVQILGWVICQLCKKYHRPFSYWTQLDSRVVTKRKSYTHFCINSRWTNSSLSITYYNNYPYNPCYNNNPSFHYKHPLSSPLHSYWFIATNIVSEIETLIGCYFPASLWILSLIPFPLSFSINAYVFVCTCFMPLKKVRIGSKAKAIYPIHYYNNYYIVVYFAYVHSKLLTFLNPSTAGSFHNQHYPKENVTLFLYNYGATAHLTWLQLIVVSKQPEIGPIIIGSSLPHYN